MRKIIITENQFNKVYNRLLSEQITGNNTNERQSKFDFGFIQKLDGSLFKNGIDVINVNNPQFVDALTKLRKVPSTYNITIIGGASKVGQSNGYDNVGLANKRASNFINVIKNIGVNVSNYKIGSPVVGGSDIKNSPEANAAQFVKIIVKKPDDIKLAIDNTSITKPKVDPASFGKLYRNITVPVSEYNKIIDLLKKNGIKLV